MDGSLCPFAPQIKEVYKDIWTLSNSQNLFRLHQITVFIYEGINNKPLL